MLGIEIRERAILVKILIISILSYVVLVLLLSQFDVGILFSRYPMDLTRAFLAAIIIFVPTLYALSYFVGARQLNFDYRDVLMYMGMASLWGPLFEIIINKLSSTLLKVPFWEYQIFPLHDGFTSGLMYVFWSLYGLHMYWLHQAVRWRGIESKLSSAILVGIDAIAIEILLSTFFIITAGSYLFFYTPGDLSHLSTGLVFIPYFIFGYLGIQMLSEVRCLPQRAWLGLCCFVVGYFTMFVL